MIRAARCLLRPAAGVAGLIAAAAALCADPPAPDAEPAAPETETPAPISVDEARGRARLLHDTYESTLHVIHRRYFDQDEKDAIPARALEDIFDSVDEATGTTTRWISVNTPPMNVDHAPREGFETDAAQALGEGRKEFELVNDGVYRRVGAVRLSASCLKCHESGLTKQIRNERVTGLVISMPVRTD